MHHHNKKLVLLICLFGISMGNLIQKMESISCSLKNMQDKLDDDDDDKCSFSQNKFTVEGRDRSWKNPNLPFWSKLKYAGDSQLPDTSQKLSRSYPMFFFAFDENNNLIDKESETAVKGIYNKNLFFL